MIESNAILLSIASGSPVTSLKKLETCGAEYVGAAFVLAAVGLAPARRLPQPAASNAAAARTVEMR